MVQGGTDRDRGVAALAGVNSVCRGCGRTFTPTRRTQRHCRPSCRVLALEQRRRADIDLFSQVADAIEYDVITDSRVTEATNGERGAADSCRAGVEA